MAYYKFLFSRFSVLINYTMWYFNLFTASSCFPHFSSHSGFSGSRFFWVQVFQGPGFPGSRFFRVRIQGLGSGFRSSPKEVSGNGGHMTSVTTFSELQIQRKTQIRLYKNCFYIVVKWGDAFSKF